jgi:hypothetical protein
MNRNGLYYHLIIKRMEYLDREDIRLDKEFFDIYFRIHQKYKGLI